MLVLSYEFTYSPFSGNGVLCRSLVKGLLAQGCKVLVICCRPHALSPAAASGADRHIASPEVSPSQAAALVVRPVELPAGALIGVN